MDLRPLKEKASRLSAEGKFERAEVLYRQLLTHAPRDSALWLKHAEVLRRLDRIDDALSSYRMSATLLAEEGHKARAVASLKIALALRPADVDLVSDIIRLELRLQRDAEAARAGEPRTEPLAPAGPPDLHEGPTAALLALPMYTASESRLTALVQDVASVPPPAPSAPRIPLEVETPLVRWPQVRRLSDSEVAIKPSPFAHWIVLHAESPLEVRFFADFPVPEHAVWLEEPTR